MLLILSYPILTLYSLTTADPTTTGERGQGVPGAPQATAVSRLPPLLGCFGSQLWQKGTAPHQTDKLKSRILMSQELTEHGSGEQLYRLLEQLTPWVSLQSPKRH